jgi:hypothetical protein
MHPVYCIILLFAALNVGRLFSRKFSNAVVHTGSGSAHPLLCVGIFTHFLLRSGLGGIAQLTKSLEMMQPAVSYAVTRGELIAKGRNYNAV